MISETQLIEVTGVGLLVFVIAVSFLAAAIVGILLYLDVKSIKRRAAGIPDPQKTRPQGFEVKTSGDIESMSDALVDGDNGESISRHRLDRER